jgi:hypothetical protein
MLVRFAIKSKLRKSGIPNPESLLVAVDYLNDKGEITARGRNNDGDEIVNAAKFTPSKEAGDNADLYKTLLSKKKYKELDAVVMLFDLTENVLTSQVLYKEQNGNQVKEILTSRL